MDPNVAHNENWLSHAWEPTYILPYVYMPTLHWSMFSHNLLLIIIFLCSHFSSPPPNSCGIFSAFSLLYCGIFALQYKVLELNIFELVLYSTEKPFKWWKHLQAPPLLKAVSCFISQLEQRLQTHNHNHGRLFSVMATLFLFTPVSSGDHETITICKLSLHSPSWRTASSRSPWRVSAAGFNAHTESHQMFSFN